MSTSIQGEALQRHFAGVETLLLAYRDTIRPLPSPPAVDGRFSAGRMMRLLFLLQTAMSVEALGLRVMGADATILVATAAVSAFRRAAAKGWTRGLDATSALGNAAPLGAWRAAKSRWRDE